MRNQFTLDALVAQLQANCGDELAACKAVGVSVQFVTQWRKDDKETDETLTEAQRVGTLGLISAAIKRGVHGVEEDVWFKGVSVGTKVVYSDGLLGKLLEAKLPEFNKKTDPGGGVQVNVNVANLMPRASTYQEWLAMKQRTLDGPSDAIEVQVTDVTEEERELSFADVEL